MATSWSSADIKSGAEYGIYDDPSSMGTETLEDNDFQNPTCLKRFTNGIRSIWATKQTEDIEKNKDLYIQTTLRELVIYIIFLIVLMIIAFGMTSGSMYWFSNLLYGLFVTNNAPNIPAYQALGSASDFWTFVNNTLLSGLYWNSWYNSLNVQPEELNFIYYENKLIGLPRIRQVRMDNNTCIIPTEFQNYISQCYDSYSMYSESTKSFGPGSSTAWNYTSAADLGSMPFQGSVSTYGGGGYYLDLPLDQTNASNILNDLYNNLWIDHGTRAVIIDFTVYNANINLFCIIKLVVEFPAVGGVIPNWDFRTVKLIRYVTPFDYFVLACELVFLVFVIYYVVEEIIEIRKLRLSYFKSVWNNLDIIVLFISSLCITFNIYRTIAVQTMLGNLLLNGYQHPNFDYLSFYQLIFNYMIAITVFLAWVKIFKYISFNKTMTQLSSTLGRCSKDLLGFAVMFFIIFFAFAQLGYLLFGSKLQTFSALHYSIFTLYRIILGDFTFSDFQSVHVIIGPVYFILYVFFVFFVLFNMFLAIINDTYSEVKAELGDKDNEFELGEYFRQRTEMVLEKLHIKKEKIIDMQSAIVTGDTNNDGKMDFDEWKTELKKRGYEDAEIESVFARYDIDGDRVLDEAEQIKMQNELEKQKASINNEIMTEQSELLDNDLGIKKSMIKGISVDEYKALDERVEQMEINMELLLSKLDTIVQSLENMEKAKHKRKKAMGKILNTLKMGEHLSELERKEKLESLIQNEICKLNEESVLTQRVKSSKYLDFK